MRDRDPIAGERLAAAIAELYRKPGDYPRNENQLHKASGVSRSQLTQWKKGTAEPTVATMRRIADAFHEPVATLWLAWLGVTVPTGSLAGIERQLERIRDAITDAGGGVPQIADAHVAIDAAREDRAQEPGADPPSVPDASSPPGRPPSRTRRR